MRHPVAKAALASAEEYYEYLLAEDAGLDRQEATLMPQLTVVREVWEGGQRDVYHYRTTPRKKYREGDTLSLVLDEDPGKGRTQDRDSGEKAEEEDTGRLSAVVFSYNDKTGRIRLGLAMGVEPPDRGWLEVDLRWLVKAFRDWLGKHGAALPGTLSGGVPQLPMRRVRDALSRVGDRLHGKQSQAIDAALGSRYTYVWGPPGTGKTKEVLANLATALVAAGKRVLVIAPTNRALENALDAVATRLGRIGLGKEKVLRLGLPSRDFLHRLPQCCMPAEVKRARGRILAQIDQVNARLAAEEDGAESKDGALKGRESLRERLVELEGRLQRVTGDHLKSRDVVGATADTFVSLYETDGMDFDWVLADEAGYLPVLKILPPLALGTPLTLFGDHMQLPPVCEAPEEDRVVQAYWGRSCIHLDSVWASPTRCPRDLAEEPTFRHTNIAVLTKSFRFGKNLAELLDKHFYRVGFTGLDGEANATRIEVVDAPLGSPPQEKRHSPAEVEVAIELVRGREALEGLDRDDAALITPYKNQAKALRKAWGRKAGWIEMINTHQTQGLEWQTVIFSVVDGASGARPWFTDSRRRQAAQVLNTTISRAKARLIVVLDKAFWMGSRGQFLGELAKIAEPVDHSWRPSVKANPVPTKETELGGPPKPVAKAEVPRPGQRRKPSPRSVSSGLAQSLERELKKAEIVISEATRPWFKSGEWFAVGETVATCPRCDSVLLGFRAPYKASGRVSHYWGLACKSCQTLIGAPDLDKQSRAALYRSSKYRPA